MRPNDLERILEEKPVTDLVQEYLFDGIPYCFKDSPEQYNLFRKTICNKFNIHPQNFTVVGSAKIGFSLSPDKYGKPFSDSSDIDVVLVSEELFQNLWIQLLEYKRTASYRFSNQYVKKRFEDFQHILFFGSIRLDMISEDFPFAKEWWEFFNNLSIDRRFGPRRIRAMIFKSWKHVSYYYENGIRKGIIQNEGNRI